MPIYVTVLKSMAETAANVDDVGKWWEESKKMLENMGVRVISAYAMLGRYDGIVIYEAPDEKVAMSLALVSSTGKYAPSETWTAVSMEDLTQIAKRIKR
ncbi:GYD domain-containing protein [Chloroflexota bacterium]